MQKTCASYGKTCNVCGRTYYTYGDTCLNCIRKLNTFTLTDKERAMGELTNGVDTNDKEGEGDEITVTEEEEEDEMGSNGFVELTDTAKSKVNRESNTKICPKCGKPYVYSHNAQVYCPECKRLMDLKLPLPNLLDAIAGSITPDVVRVVVIRADGITITAEKDPGS